MSTRQYRAIVLTLLPLPVIGCSQTTLNADAWPSQPYYGGPSPAVAATEKTGGIIMLMRSSGDVLWTSSEAENSKKRPKRIRGTTVAHEVATYLQGTWLDFHKIEHWPADTNHSIRRIAEQNPLSIRYPLSLFPHTVVICSLEPTIVIAAEVPIGTIFQDGSFNAFHASLRAPNLAAPEDAYVVGLPGGIVYGTSLPPADALWWASPDMDVGLTPLIFDQNGEAAIELPWGTLRIVPAEHGFVVRPDPTSPPAAAASPAA